jgi:pimeloyl-ACP methyl ester carboxylesterase
VPSFVFNQSRLYYTKSGVGSKALLLFHGFGQTHRAFNELTTALSGSHTLYAFDLFFHGESNWGYEEQAMEKAYWKELLQQFLHENNIHEFSVLGFSMGGKFALASAEAFPDRVKQLFLLAPDGIKTSFWYSLATYPIAFRKLFKSMISRYARFHTVAQAALRLRLIDKGVLRFVEAQMSTEEKRKRVYLSWVVFRHLQFNLQHMATLLNQYQISCTLVIGKHDKIITAKNMKRFTKKLHHIQFNIIEAGHTDLIHRYAAQLTDTPNT